MLPVAENHQAGCDGSSTAPALMWGSGTSLDELGGAEVNAAME